MTMWMKRVLPLAVAAVAVAELPAMAAFPDHPIKVIVPYAAGGPADVTARLIFNKAGERLGQSFLIDNRTGAGGNIGTAAGAGSTADGYTLTLITPAQIINMTLFASPGYDIARDFTPVSLFNTAPGLLLVNPKLEVNTLAELIALAKSKPGQLSFASQGVGVAPHLMMEMIKKRAGIDLVHVPYRGSAPALNDLLANTVPMMIDSMVTGLPHVKSGALRGLAVSTAKRSPLAPEIPTIAEAGLPDFDASLWYGVVAPAKTPSEIVAVLGAAIGDALKLPKIRERLLVLGSTPAEPAGPAAFAKFLKDEEAKWPDVVRASGAKAQ
jgi:tripartite-type tricarboxylate transporter receptor subunit TctC